MGQVVQGQGGEDEHEPRAADRAGAEVAQADSSIQGFLRDGNQIVKMKDMLKNTEKVVEQFSKDRTSAADDKTRNNKTLVITHFMFAYFNRLLNHAATRSIRSFWCAGLANW